MPIAHFSTRQPKKVVASPEEVNAEVLNIMSTVGSSYRDFVQASDMYNSDFFRAEDPEFKLALCQALRSNFESYPNSFWENVLRQPSGSAQENI